MLLDAQFSVCVFQHGQGHKAIPAQPTTRDVKKQLVVQLQNVMCMIVAVRDNLGIHAAIGLVQDVCQLGSVCLLCRIKNGSDSIYETVGQFSPALSISQTSSGETRTLVSIVERSGSLVMIIYWSLRSIVPTAKSILTSLETTFME